MQIRNTAELVGKS